MVFGTGRAQESFSSASKRAEETESAVAASKDVSASSPRRDSENLSQLIEIASREDTETEPPTRFGYGFEMYKKSIAEVEARDDDGVSESDFDSDDMDSAVLTRSQVSFDESKNQIFEVPSREDLVQSFRDKRKKDMQKRKQASKKKMEAAQKMEEDKKADLEAKTLEVEAEKKDRDTTKNFYEVQETSQINKSQHTHAVRLFHHHQVVVVVQTTSSQSFQFLSRHGISQQGKVGVIAYPKSIGNGQVGRICAAFGQSTTIALRKTIAASSQTKTIHGTIDK